MMLNRLEITGESRWKKLILGLEENNHKASIKNDKKNIQFITMNYEHRKNTNTK